MPVDYDNSLESQTTYAVQDEFNGGMVSAFNPTKIAQNQIQYALNVMADRDGLAETRVGVTSLGAISGSHRIVELTHYYNDQSYVIGFANSGSFLWDGSSITTLSGYTWSGTGVDCVQAGNQAFAVDGVGKLGIFSLTSVGAWRYNQSPDVNPAPEGASVVVFHLGQLFLTGYADASKADYVNGSDIFLNGTPRFDDNLWGFAVGGDGSPIVAGKSWKNTLLAWFKRNKIYVTDVGQAATSAQTFTTYVASENIGCCASKSVQNVGNDIFFLADDGVRSLQLTTYGTVFNVSPPLSLPIRDWIARINKSAVHTSFSAYRNGRYILAVPIDSASTPNYQIVWNTFLNNGNGGWEGVWTIDGVSAMTISDDDKVGALFIGSNTGKLGVFNDNVASGDYSVSTFQDFGGDIATKCTTRAFDFNETVNKKRGKQVELFLETYYGAGANIAVGVILDRGSEGTLFTQTISDTGVNLPIDLPFDLNSGTYTSVAHGISSQNRFRDLAISVASSAGRLILGKVALSARVKAQPRPASDGRGI